MAVDPYERIAELEAELAGSREQQTGMADILRLISSTPHDLQRVLDAIVKTAARLVSAQWGVLIREDHGVLRTESVYEVGTGIRRGGPTFERRRDSLPLRSLLDG